MLCATAYWLTESAGKYGTLVIVLVASTLYGVRLFGWRQKMKTFIKSTVALTVVLTVFAFTNEYVTKPLLQLPRPSHSFIFNRADSLADLNSFYQLKVEDRQAFLKGMIENNFVRFDNIDGRVLSHWIDEAGYSFPSGHSFNAFLLASILAFSMYHVQNYTVRKLFFLPFVWAVLVAISRIAVGAHSVIDVSVGAGLGILISNTLIYFDTTRRIIVHKQYIE